jgi:hypothetical protein
VDPGQVQDGVDLADEVILRNRLVEVELIEQVPLALTASTHHHPLPSPIALANRNHARHRPSTDFCNSICQTQTWWTWVAAKKKPPEGGSPNLKSSLKLPSARPQ